jgi:phage host-nuclease inhibitor protein Gam
MTKKEQKELKIILAKPQPQIFSSWDEIDQKLRRMGEIDIAVLKLEGDMTLRINEIRAEYETKAEGLKYERLTIEGGIAAYVEDHKDEFAKTRSKELTFGVIAFRVVKKIVIRSIKATIAAMHALHLEQYIRTIEDPDKELMVDLDDNTLSKVGAVRKVDDKLRIEPNIERIKEAA